MVAEILKANPDFLLVLNQPGTPVIEYLKASKQDIGFLDVNPVVLQWRAIWLSELELVCEQTDGDEVAVDETFADLSNFRRNRNRETANEVLDGHGGKEVVALQSGTLALRIPRLD